MRFFHKNKVFKSTEEVVSMFLGLVIVVVVIGLVFNFIQKRKGDVTLPGVSSNLDISQTKKEETEDDAKESEYVVVKGDNLWKIAELKYNNGFLWNEIAKANNLKNPRIISAGQKLIIPEVSVVGNVPQNKINKPIATINKIEVGEYVVVKNDSLWKIAIRAYGDGYQWVKIWNENKKVIPNSNVIRVGTKLVIPKLNS